MTKKNQQSVWNDDTFWPREEDTLLYYDGPRLWTTTAPGGELYAVVNVELNTEGNEVYVAVPLGEAEKEQWLSGRLDTRQIFANPPKSGPIYSVTVERGGEMISSVLGDVPGKWLPKKGAYLVSSLSGETP